MDKPLTFREEMMLLADNSELVASILRPYLYAAATAFFVIKCFS